MIFVTLGTQDKKFDRLLKAIQKQIDKGNIKDEVVVQAGCTEFESDDMKIYSLMDGKQFNQYIKECDLLITHGGVGSILSGVKKKKTVIAVPRLSKYDEHENDHQKQIVNEFAKAGYILALKDLNRFSQILNKAKDFVPKPYKSNNREFTQYLENYIESH